MATPPEEVDVDLRAQFAELLREWGLPDTLLGFIEDMLAQNTPPSEVAFRLRQTPEYKAAYPENEQRLANGFAFMPEAEIRAYRNEGRRIAKQMLGLEVSNQELAGLITQNVSLAEWERRLQTFRDFQRFGPAVRQVLEQEIGLGIEDDRVFAFMSPDFSTPELDRAYQRALIRGQPEALGLGIRPEEEADILQQFGINPEQAFRGFQGIAAELPRQERLAAIEAEIGRNADNFPGTEQALGGSTFATLFRAIQLGDPEATSELRRRMAREVARFQAQGGPVRQGTAATGLLTPGQRQ